MRLTWRGFLRSRRLATRDAGAGLLLAIGGDEPRKTEAAVHTRHVRGMLSAEERDRLLEVCARFHDVFRCTRPEAFDMDGTDWMALPGGGHARKAHLGD